MDEFKIDYDAMIQEIQDNIFLGVLKMSIKDGPEKDLVLKYLDIFIKHGIPVTTAIEIIKELSSLSPDKKE